MEVEPMTLRTFVERFNNWAIGRLVTDLNYTYALLTKCEVKMAEY